MVSQRSTTLTFACIAALSAGSNYLYSAYAPQLSSRLSLTSTETNVIGLSANLGVYLSGVPFGLIIDKRGPRLCLILSALLLGLGYTGVRAFYDGGESGLYSRYGVKGMAFAEFLTGVGSSAGLSSAANATAKSFGSKSRGSRMSLVMSSFGLSAFFYSTLSHSSILAGGDPTSNFLLLLSIGCCGSMLLGSIFIKSPSTPPSLGYRTISTLEEGSHLPSTPRLASPRPSTPTTPNGERSVSRTSLLGSSNLGIYVNNTTSPESSSSEEEDRIASRRSSKNKEMLEQGLNITGWELLRQKDFWILFGIMGLCSGTGLMYINNIGTVVATLEPLGSDAKSVVKLQASLVSLLSIFNCLGRLLAGFSSDYFAHHVAEPYRIQRVWWLVPMSSMFVASQLMASYTDRAEGWNGLALPTAMTGTAYGMLFGLFPILSIEYFGITSFSSNNGVISLAPAIFGNSCNILFGRIYDSHVPTISIPKLSTPPELLDIPLIDSETGEYLEDLIVEPVVRLIKRLFNFNSIIELEKRGGSGTLAVDRLCVLKTACFSSAFHMTTLMTMGAVGLSIYISIRRSRRD